MPVTGYTVSELMEKSGKSRASVVTLLSRHDIKPLSYEAIYPPEALDVILAAKRGRPKNPSVEKAQIIKASIDEDIKIGNLSEIEEKIEAISEPLNDIVKSLLDSSDEEFAELSKEVREADIFSGKAGKIFSSDGISEFFDLARNLKPKPKTFIEFLGALMDANPDVAVRFVDEWNELRAMREQKSVSKPKKPKK